MFVCHLCRDTESCSLKLLKGVIYKQVNSGRAVGADISIKWIRGHAPPENVQN